MVSCLSVYTACKNATPFFNSLVPFKSRLYLASQFTMLVLFLFLLLLFLLYSAAAFGRDCHFRAAP